MRKCTTVAHTARQIAEKIDGKNLITAKHISFAANKRWFSRLLRLIKSRGKDAICYREGPHLARRHNQSAKFLRLCLFTTAAKLLSAGHIVAASQVPPQKPKLDPLPQANLACSGKPRGREFMIAHECMLDHNPHPQMASWMHASITAADHTASREPSVLEITVTRDYMLGLGLHHERAVRWRPNFATADHTARGEPSAWEFTTMRDRAFDFGPRPRTNPGPQTGTTASAAALDYNAAEYFRLSADFDPHPERTARMRARLAANFDQHPERTTRVRSSFAADLDPHPERTTRVRSSFAAGLGLRPGMAAWMHHHNMTAADLVRGRGLGAFEVATTFDCVARMAIRDAVVIPITADQAFMPDSTALEMQGTPGIGPVQLFDLHLDNANCKKGVTYRPWVDAWNAAGIPQEARLIELLVMHYTVASTQELTYNTFDDCGVSAHFTIGPTGKVLRTVDPKRFIAFHAGLSAYGYKIRLNNYSIGVEHVHPGYTKTLRQIAQFPLPIQIPGSTLWWHPFSEAQFLRSMDLCQYILEEYNIDAWNVVTHGDIAIGRKHDIGPLWPHRRAALEFNVGIWPLELQIDLNRFADFVYDDYFYFITCIGYVPPDDTERGRASTVVAYKEHFATHNISSELDKTTRVTILRHVITLRHYVDHGRHYRFFNAKLDIWLDTHEYGVRAFSDFF